MGKYLKSAYFYNIIKCKVDKPKKEGGGKHETPKYCLSVLSDRSAGFLVSSKPRKSNIGQIKIYSDEMNNNLRNTTSYANLAKLKKIDEKEVASAIELCPIPCSVAEKIIKEMEKIIKESEKIQIEDSTPTSEDNLSPRDAKKVIMNLKKLVPRSR